MSVRAKFRCGSVESFGQNPEATRIFRFSAVYDDGIPENQRYAKYTPSGQLQISVDNPAVSFEPGAYYFLDFTPVE